nr:hypothetical protein [Nitrosomonas nitrosa]
MSTKSVNELRTFLYTLRPGSNCNWQELERLLANCWDELEGSFDHAMTGSKLTDRMENLTWKPPILQFLIERHGGTMNGSSRAEVHTWQVNVDLATATCVNDTGRRQLKPMARPWKHQNAVAEFAKLITSRKLDPRLNWRSRNYVVVKIADIVPKGGANQTTIARRKRFRGGLTEELKRDNWHECRKPNHYEYREPDPA